MKKIKMCFFVLLIAGFAMIITGCYGSFALTKKVYKWNGTVGDKFVNEVVFLAFNIVPVYGATVFIDGILLNSIEFWTGKNPIALKMGENHIQNNGKDYTLNVKENHVDILRNNKIEAVLDFNRYDQSWSITKNGETHLLASVKGNIMTAYSTSGLPINSKYISNN